MNKAELQQPFQNPTARPRPQRVLCVWLPNWPIQRIQAVEPKLADAPLVLSARDSRRGLVVMAANLSARSHGIRPTMRVSEAIGLAAAEQREHEPHEDIEALCALAEEAQQFSPIVGLEQLDKQLWAGRTLPQPECLLLDVTGIGHLFGGEVELMRGVARWLAPQNYFACMAIAGSVGAAWALANYATRGHRHMPDHVEVGTFEPPATTPPNQQTGVEPVDTEASKQTNAPSTQVSHVRDEPSVAPDPIADEPSKATVPDCRYCHVPPKIDLTAVATLPLAALRLEQTTVQSLRRLGLRSVGELQQLPRDGLATRLGSQLIRRWDQITAQAEEPLVALHSRPDWCLEHALEIPTSDRSTIVELTRRLCRELAQRMNQRGEGALRIVCRLDLTASQPIVLQLGLFRPTNEPTHLEALLSGQLEQQLRISPRYPLWRLSLQATMTAPMQWRQTDLFSAGEADNRQQIARLVDNLSNRLGRKQVTQARLRREAQPELAATMLPMTGRRPNGMEQETYRKLSSRMAQSRAEPSRDDPLRRPLVLLATPEAIQVRRKRVPDATHTSVNANTQAANLPPQTELTHVIQFESRGSWQTVVDSCGPERLESGWWKGPSCRRDYYRWTVASGSMVWVYRDMQDNAWYLHGLFD